MKCAVFSDPTSHNNYIVRKRLFCKTSNLVYIGIDAKHMFYICFYTQFIDKLHVSMTTGQLGDTTHTCNTPISAGLVLVMVLHRLGKLCKHFYGMYFMILPYTYNISRHKTLNGII